MISIEFLQENFEVRNGNLFWRLSGSGRTISKPAGVTTPKGYRVVRVAGELYRAHRIVFAITHGRWPSKQIDHINLNKLDNSPENLREATNQQNSYNTTAYKNNKTGVKGVWWDKNRHKWNVQIAISGRKMFLGRHDDLELAAFIYSCAAEKYHGEYFRL